ncbi:M96 mating-specific protein family [Phytophthora cinnamomi]|uniref:M96 mating-specific protein family n=1 Tax=Phytophthora cinnamomi TaxID=4785 RepID=UPI003559933D|nr:M96 mating-specific protein family [Phytophthora cinnamomi]
MASPPLAAAGGRRGAAALDVSLSDASDLLATLSSSTPTPLSPLSDVCSPFPALLDDVPSLDELLLPNMNPPLVEMDPTLLFPEPTELLDQSQEADATPSASSDAQTPPAAPAAAPRRKRRKDELEFLRLKARELQQQLQQLKEREDSAVAGAAEEQHKQTNVSAWRRVARRQLEGKKRAERENEKLRGMVEGQLCIVQNLEKLLRKRSALEESGAWASERKRVRVENEAETVVFDRILGRLDDQYKQTDAAFLQNNFARKMTDGHHMQVKPDGAYGMFMEFLASKILPFELHATATQFWRSMAQPHLKLRDGHYSLIDGSEDTLSAKMAFTVQHKKHQVMKDAWFVVKRYIEEDSSKENSLESTIIQTCVQVRTELPEVMPSTQEEMAILTDIVTSSFLENLDGIHQSVEDALVEAAMQLS